MYGSGLIKGLGVTLKHWFSKEVTEQYPEERPDLPPATHYFFEYIQEKCIACNLCVRACPNQVIELTAEKNEAGKRVPTGYVMDLSYCLFCGLCIEACPTAALLNSPNFELGVYNRANSTIDFFSKKPREMNDTFDKLQADFWAKHQPKVNPIGRPTPYVAPKPDPKPAAPKATEEKGEQ